MRSNLVPIGNSRGVRIPKAILEQTGLEDEVEMEVRGSELVIRSAHKARANWDEAFHRMALRGDDTLLDRETPTNWDETEWKW